MNIAKENKIRQNIALSIEKDDPQHSIFLTLLKAFVEVQGKQKIEGVIDKISISTGYSDDIDIKIVTLKEDKLNLIEDLS